MSDVKQKTVAEDIVKPKRALSLDPIKKVEDTSVDVSSIKKSRPKKSLRFEQEKDEEIVTGIFRNYETPGGTLKFAFRKYKGPVRKYALTDGEVCKIPLGVAKHLNKGCWYPIHKHAVNANGKPIATIGSKKRRCGFQGLDFIDPEDFSTVDSSIITVEKV